MSFDDDIILTIEWAKSILPLIKIGVVIVPAIVIGWSIFNAWNITRNR